MLIFSELSWVYYLFSCFNFITCMFSVYYYLYVAAGRFHNTDPHHKDELIWGYEPYIFATVMMEFVFFVDMIL